MSSRRRKNSGTDADFQRAKASSDDANTAYAAGDIREALAHAEAAYRAYPNASTALIMARIYGNTGKAKSAFRWFLVACNHKPTEAVVGEIDEALKTHGAVAKLGVLRVETVPAEAAVAVDGAGVVTSGAYVGLSFGNHSVAVSAASFAAVTKDIVVVEAGAQELSVTLEAVTVVEASQPSQSASIAAPLGLIIGGLVAAGAGAGLHVWALGADADVSDLNGKWSAQGGSEEPRARYDSLSADASLGSTLAFVLYGVGAAAVVTGAVLLAINGGSAEDSGVDVVLTPALMPAGGGLSVGGTF